jgi:hypothetical protein
LAAVDPAGAVTQRCAAQPRRARGGGSPGQGEDIVPIPGTRSERRLAENIAAATVALGTADLERIHTILPDGASGARYPASMMPVSE